MGLLRSFLGPTRDPLDILELLRRLPVGQVELVVAAVVEGRRVGDGGVSEGIMSKEGFI